jgi:alkylhydroperoxidase/carboxymuconolactone decarboxylase family protein YurZ
VPAAAAGQTCGTVADYRQTLRELAIRDQRLLSEVLASDEANLRASQLDVRAHALVRLGALIAAGAPMAVYKPVVDEALEAGASPEQIVGVLIAVATVTGLPRVVSAALPLGLSIGYDVQAALEEWGVAEPG